MRYGRLPRRLSGLIRSAAEIGAEVDEEIAFHLAMRAEALERQGMDARTAREQAEREFGDAEALRRELRRRDGGVERRLRLATWLDEVRQDVRFALRSLLRTPVFTTVALATLTLGIGASTAMFAVVDAVVLKPLPYGEPERLVRLWPGQVFNSTMVEAIASRTPSLESVTGVSLHGLTLTGRGDAVRLNAQMVDAGYFDVFGVRPALGRAIDAEHRDPARSDVVLLSDALWRTRFGGDPAVIGQRIELDGYGHRTREIIGVMPRGFVAPAAEGVDGVDVWAPLHVRPGLAVAADSGWYVSPVLGRLREGATVAALSAEVGAAARRVRAETGAILPEESVREAGATRLLDDMVGSTRQGLWLLLGAVALVLLLACANLANLLLARGERRRGELGARAALGGTRARLVRGLVTEGAVLAAAGAAGGVILGRVILDALRVADSSGLPRMSTLALDTRVVAFAVATACACMLLFALLPALRATAGDLRPSLGAGRRTAGTTRAGRRLGSALIGAEVALAMVLVTGAALLIQSFRTVRAVDPGLQTDGVLAVELAPAPGAYERDRTVRFYDGVLEGVRGIAGVQAAGAIHLLPFTWANWRFPYLAEGHAPPANAPLPTANFRIVTPGYFAAVGVRLLAGRDFDASDLTGDGTVIINRTLAEQLWPGAEAVGRRIDLFGSVPLRVVGVVGDVRQHALDDEVQPELYRPLGVWSHASMVLMVRTDGDPRAVAAAVRRVIRDADPGVPVASARPLADVLGDSLAQRRFFARVLSFFGFLALVLGGVGVYGVMAYSLNARSAEFSVRVALGATHGEVLHNALRTAAVPVIAGLISGTVASLAAMHLLAGLLFGVRPHEPAAFVAAFLVLGGVAFLAGWLPARRVLRMDPANVLKAG